MSDLMTLTGYTANAQGFLENTTVPIDGHMPFTNAPSTSGMPVTVSGYFGMLYNFYKLLFEHPDLSKYFQGVYYVEFSKASLFRLLSQEGCEFVRFHYAVPDADLKITLMAEGVRMDGKSVGYETLLAKATAGNLATGPGDPGVEERGNGGESHQPHVALFEALQQANHLFGSILPTDLVTS
ncbi:hypothetical protein [Chitinophaga solisilvae]|uniref:Uncharacterized protein n=1 Tax=Chitinophaga solisilvae TaxID=1233460 RepID=A0A3S1CQX1_9BACT|nr:hypothetical protein [Chitinophaga solisilvae]NSL86828.1 hypothetical protein [Chitinophaga solisilvae]